MNSHLPMSQLCAKNDHNNWIWQLISIAGKFRAAYIGDAQFHFLSGGPTVIDWLNLERCQHSLGFW